MSERLCGPVGTVIEVLGNRARVSVDRQAACEGCKACGILMGTKEVTVEAEAPFEVLPGDRVVLDPDGAGVLRSAALAYLLPLGGFLAGLGGATGFGASEATALVFGVAGLAAAYLVAHMADKRSGAPGFRISSKTESR